MSGIETNETPSPSRSLWIRRLARRVVPDARPLMLALARVGAPPAAASNFDWAGDVELDAEGLSSDDPGKRLEAVSELGKYDIALTQPYLLKALGDDDDKVKLAAA